MRHGPVLIVEIDSAVIASIANSLKAQGFEVRQAVRGKAVSREGNGRAAEVDLFDLSSPRNGEADAPQTLRSFHQPVAVIVLTFLSGDKDAAERFPVADLVARVLGAMAHGRKPQGRDVSFLQVGDICLDALAHRVTKAEQKVHLTPKEFKLLQVLMEHEGLPLTHHQLLELVWGPEHGSKRDYLRTYISQLRRKLESNPSAPKYLLTESHKGYRFQNPAAATP